MPNRRMLTSCHQADLPLELSDDETSDEAEIFLAGEDEPLFTADGATLNTDGFVLGENGEFAPSQENLFATFQPNTETDTFAVVDSPASENLPLFTIADGGLFTPGTTESLQFPVADAGTTDFTFSSLEPAPGTDIFAATDSENPQVLSIADTGSFNSEISSSGQSPSFSVAEGGNNEEFLQLSFAPMGTLGESQDIDYQEFAKRGVAKRVRRNRMDFP